MILDRRYYERKNMETKGAEDVLGGADSWKNVDKTEGERNFLCIVQDVESKYTDYCQLNVRAKAASAAWPTSDRCRFAVPTSLPRVFTSVWNALLNGARTDEIVYLLCSIGEIREAGRKIRSGSLVWTAPLLLSHAEWASRLSIVPTGSSRPTA